MQPFALSPSELGREVFGRLLLVLLPLLGGAAGGIAIACLVGQPPWGDQSMYLMAAAKVLDGGRIGQDVVDVNPPLILWLFEIPVAVARATGALPRTATQVLLGLLTAGILAWCLLLTRRAGGGRLPAIVGWPLLILLLYATTIHPWYHVGTREHILVLLLLPYLFLAVARHGGAALPSYPQLVAAGLLAAVAVGLKPQHVLGVLAVEAFLAWRVSLRLLWRPEVIGLAAGCLVYALAIVVFALEYLTVVVPFAYLAYLDRGQLGWTELLGATRTAKIVIAVLLWLAIRRSSRWRGAADLFMAAGLAALVAYLLQRKGYEYQLVPALAFLHLSVGLAITGAILQRLSPIDTQGSRATNTALPLAAALVVAPLYYPGQIERARTAWTDARKVAHLAMTPFIPPGTTAFMVSPVVAPLSAYLLRRESVWGSRFTAMWMTEALVTRDLSEPRNAALAQWTVSAVVEDLLRYRPGLVLVDRCQDTAFPPCGAFGDGRGDLLAWFLRDGEFKAAWARYRRHGQVGPYDLWCLADDDRACRAILDGVTGTVPTARAG